VEWVHYRIVAENPVRVKSVLAGEAAWLGVTRVHFLLETTTGSKFTINAFIESSLTGTRLSRLDLYYSGLAPIDKLTRAELSYAIQNPDPKGRRVALSVDIVGSGQTVDLKKLLPEAFADQAQ
jgi:hypothetical protein